MHYANILAFHQVHDSEEKGFLNKWRIFGSNQKWSATPWIILDFSAVGINFFTQAVTILQWFSAIIKSNRQIFSVSVHQVIFLFDFLKHFINIKVFDVYDNRGVDVLAVIRCSCGFLRYLGYCFAVCSGTELGVLFHETERFWVALLCVHSGSFDMSIAVASNFCIIVLNIEALKLVYLLCFFAGNPVLILVA